MDVDKCMSSCMTSLLSPATALLYELQEDDIKEDSHSRVLKSLNVLTERNTGLGKQGSTSACDRGGGNMRGRGQMRRSAWASVEIIETVHRERSVCGGKTRHFHRKLMESPHRQRKLAGTTGKCQRHRVCQVTSHQHGRFLCKIIVLYNCQ